ncbi:hypothetical protein EI94DRAFT_937325 [Lactarius quietus]|nr:hypothetical protein EI94DRAFT_937325 [Lactarius quietus]
MDFFHILYGFPAMPFPSLIPRYRSSIPRDNVTYMELDKHDHLDDYPHSNGSSDDPLLRHVDAGLVNAAIGESDAEASPLYPPHDYQGHLEGLGLASIPSQFGPPIDSGKPLPTECLSTYAPDPLPSPPIRRRGELDHSYFQRTLPTPSPAVDVNANSPFELSSLRQDRPSIPTWGISWTIGPNESGEFSASTITYGPMRDNRSATAFLDTRLIDSMSSLKTTASTHSANYPAIWPPNHSGPIDPHSDYGYRPAHSDFRPARQRRQRTVAVSSIASSHVSTPHRTPKKHWCKACDTGFTQRQGLLRHCKNLHGLRQLCPCCRKFEWPLGRKYVLRKHFEEKHPEVALPEFLYRQDSRGCRRAT